MSMIYCEKHNRQWDSDFLEECPECEHEPKEQFEEHLNGLRWKQGMLVVNSEGERIWLKAILNEKGERIGITDCCPETSPCEIHDRRKSSPVPSQEPAEQKDLITLTGNQAEAILEAFGGEGTSVTIRRLPATKDEEDGSDNPAGLYLYYTEYPEEGMIFLGEDDQDYKPPYINAHPGIVPGWVMVPRKLPDEVLDLITGQGLDWNEKRDLWDLWLNALSAAPKVKP